VVKKKGRLLDSFCIRFLICDSIEGSKEIISPFFNKREKQALTKLFTLIFLCEIKCLASKSEETKPKRQSITSKRRSKIEQNLFSFIKRCVFLFCID